MGGVYGGSRTAILLNILGAPSAIATAMDGYRVVQRGEAGQAIGVITVMSFFGGVIGILVLARVAPFVSDFALSFQPRDYMLLAVLGIVRVGLPSSGSLVKGIFAGAHLAARFDRDTGLLARLRAGNILYDEDATGVLLQLYSRPLAGGMFFEIVERHGGYAGYGAPNAPFRIAAQKRLMRKKGIPKR